MRIEDTDRLSEPFGVGKSDFDRRFDSAIGADVPSAERLAKEIFNDLDENLFGVSWWNYLPVEERILISDYLYQCANGIQVNLSEAKLHYLEWLDAREKSNEKIVDVIRRDQNGELIPKMPPSKTPLDVLPSRLENLHICGFFRAIGSSLDCLGGAIIGVLALPHSLRKSDIKRAKETLLKVKSSGSKGSQLQLDFRDFLEDVKKSSGQKDWLEWADQYRNMYVHRGRRTTFHKIRPIKNPLCDAAGRLIPRAEATTHLAKYPDRSDVEALIKSKDVHLNEDAELTFEGLFNSCRNFVENVCERLVSIWKERRDNPLLLEQPQMQWGDKGKECNFDGYETDSKPLNADLALAHPNFRHRIFSASVDDAHRHLWNNSKWNK